MPTLKCAFSIPTTCECNWYTAESSEATTKCTFLNTRKVGILSTKTALVPCISTVYRSNYLKIFFLIITMNFIPENKYLHGTAARHLHIKL